MRIWLRDLWSILKVVPIALAIAAYAACYAFVGAVLYFARWNR